MDPRKVTSKARPYRWKERHPGHQLPPRSSPSTRRPQGSSIALLAATVVLLILPNTLLATTTSATDDNGASQTSSPSQLDLNFTSTTSSTPPPLVAPFFIKRPQNITKMTPQTARFDCEVSGIPQPSITWLRNGEPLQINGRVKMFETNTLVISQTVATDSGVYECHAENEAGVSIASASLILNASSNQPSPPDGLQAEVLSSSSVQLSWTPGVSPDGEDVKAYTVHYMPTSGGHELQMVAANNSVVITKLRPYTNYTFYVRAYSARSASEQSEPLTQLTGEDVPVSDPVIVLEAISPTVLQVSWTALSPGQSRGKVVSYRIHYRKHNQASYRIIEVPNPQTLVYPIKNVKAGKKYDIRVSAATSVGYRKPSDESQWPWTTFEMPSADKDEADGGKDEKSSAGGEKPTNDKIGLPQPILHLITANSSSIAASWSLPPRNKPWSHVLGFSLTAYELPNDAEVNGANFSSRADDHHLITDLKPSTLYRIQLRTFGTRGFSKHTAVKEIATLPAESDSVEAEDLTADVSSPEDVESKPLSAKSIQVMWKSVEGASFYTLRYHDANAPLDALHYRYVRSTRNQVTVDGLASYTLYGFSVSSHDSNARQGLYGQKIECETLEDLPSAPRDLSGMLIDGQNLRVSWSAPSTANGIIRKYQVFYNYDNSANIDKWMLYGELDKNAQLSITLSNLSTNTQYYVRTRAATKAGFGPASDSFAIFVPLRLNKATTQRPSSTNAHGHPRLSQKWELTIIAIAAVALASLICLIVICLLCKHRIFRTSPRRDVRYLNGQARRNGNNSFRSQPNVGLPSMYGEPMYHSARSVALNGDSKEMQSFNSPILLNGLGHASDNHLDTKGGYTSTIKMNGRCNSSGSNRLQQASTPSSQLNGGVLHAILAATEAETDLDQDVSTQPLLSPSEQLANGAFLGSPPIRSAPLVAVRPAPVPHLNVVMGLGAVEMRRNGHAARPPELQALGAHQLPPTPPPPSPPI